ncbi:hypothetical protein ACHAXS_003345 [Conticribra weissflogii]
MAANPPRNCLEVSQANFSLYTGWQMCNACGLPPQTVPIVRNGDERPQVKILLVCSVCKSTAYHDATCQRSHWASGHKKECKELRSALRPLNDLFTWCAKYEEARTSFSNHSGDFKRIFYWWDERNFDEIAASEIKTYNQLWEQSVQYWTKQDYLIAMQGFQRSLQPFASAWKNFIASPKLEEKVIAMKFIEDDKAFKFVEQSIILATRLLFCSYCELDGEQVHIARDRMVQCISILMTMSEPSLKKNESTRELMDDAWMELMLSMEEIPQHRAIARHVAKMAIYTNSCRWTDPLQRPGYMARCPLQSIPHTASEQHPQWCKTLEQNWESIVTEYDTLARNNLESFSGVGSGERGSGHDDHKVVTGTSWKEYVLFGTGAKTSDADAPITKGLLKKYVPDAVSLAEQGGGEVIFSRLAPKTRIEAHCGPTNLRWTAHLGLVVPEDGTKCRIRVGMQWHSWKPGKILLFDDSFEHEVHNDTDEERVVLLLRFWHPDLSSESAMRDDFLMEAMVKKEEAVNKRYHPPN